MNERRPQNESDFERHARQAFERSVDALDVATRSRLRDARLRALEALEPRAPFAAVPRWSLAAAATLAAVAIGWWLGPLGSPSADPRVDLAALGDLEILSGEEDLEMLTEDLEFYVWLEEQPELEPGAAADGAG
ncbi:MAG TPA: hypothetical protein VF329_09605 [Gammaproteobacteria bacterium]